MSAPNNCRLTPPQEIAPDGITLPPTLHGSARVVDSSTDALSHTHRAQFSPTFAPGDGWASAIRLNQFPSVCRRYLLVEDDLEGAGLGFTARLLVPVLMLAMREQRVLLEVKPPAGAPFARPQRNGSPGRWCGENSWDSNSCWSRALLTCSTSSHAIAHPISEL